MRFITVVFATAQAFEGSNASSPNLPRYMVVRTFPNGLDIPATDAGEAAVGGVVKYNTTKDVTWIHSHVSNDKTSSIN